MTQLLLLALAGLQAQPAPLAAERRGKLFWKTLAAECSVPAGESAVGLVREAVSLLGSPETADQGCFSRSQANGSPRRQLFS